MPKFTYKPEGAEPKTWDFSFGKFMSPERIVIEKLTGLGWAEFQHALGRDSTIAIHALLYVLLKRENPTLTPDQVQFCDDDVEGGPTTAEAQEMLADLLAVPEGERDEDDVVTIDRLREYLGVDADTVEPAAAEDADPKED